MYEAFYGLKDKPFQLNPDPTFYFGSSQHRRAMAYVEYGLHQNEGFIVITGEVGAGKTTLVRNLFGTLDPNLVVAANLVSTQLDADDTLRMIAAAFGIPTKHADKSDLLLSIEAFLVSVAAQGKRCLLVVDEAQNLTPRAVEELRMLSNFQLDTHALLQSFLIGQPEFRYILQSPHMQQLRQRVIAACHIGPLDAEETKGYIEHRLTCVGWKDNPHFQADAFEAIYEASEGVPRRINSVCDRLLLSGFLAGKQVFSREDVDEVAKEFSDETLDPKYRSGNKHYSSAEENASKFGIDAIEGIDLSMIELDDNLVRDAQQTVENLSRDDLLARLIRLERSMLRLEASNAASLSLLNRLIDNLRARRSENESNVT